MDQEFDLFHDISTFAFNDKMNMGSKVNQCSNQIKTCLCIAQYMQATHVLTHNNTTFQIL